MIKRASQVVLITFTLALSAHAGVYKCTGNDGKLQFSDTPCKNSAKAEMLPDRAPTTLQQQSEAQERAARLRAELKPQEKPTESAGTPPSAGSVTSKTGEASNEAAVAACIRDVERQGPSEKVKGEMIVACQSAGKSSSPSDDAVRDCVRSVERTGASGNEKARLLAQCHGGDVKPADYYRTRR